MGMLWEIQVVIKSGRDLLQNKDSNFESAGCWLERTSLEQRSWKLSFNAQTRDLGQTPLITSPLLTLRGLTESR